MQTLHFPDDEKKIDQIAIEFTDWDSDSTRTTNFYFDITECFERFEKGTDNYLKSKEKSDKAN